VRSKSKLLRKPITIIPPPSSRAKAMASLKPYFSLLLIALTE
jgi:hypothetical protein